MRMCRGRVSGKSSQGGQEGVGLRSGSRECWRRV